MAQGKNNAGIAATLVLTERGGYPFPGYQWDIDPLWYVPNSDLTYWAPRFGRWSYDPKNKFSAEPPDEIKALVDTYEQLKVAPNDDERIRLGREILKQHDENVWIIGTMPMPYVPMIVADDLRNVRAEATASFRQHDQGATPPAQLFFAEPNKHSWILGNCGDLGNSHDHRG